VIEKGRHPFFVAVRWLFVAAWAGLIWKLLTLPSEETPDISFIPFSDKLGHAGLYFIWGLLLCWSVDRSFRQLSRIGVGVVVVLAAACYGVASEIYQSGIGRDADVMDAIADTAGALIAQYLYFSVRLRNSLRRLILERIPGKRVHRRGVHAPFESTRLPDAGRNGGEREQRTKS
jgi:VanZ family protein